MSKYRKEYDVSKDRLLAIYRRLLFLTATIPPFNHSEMHFYHEMGVGS